MITESPVNDQTERRRSASRLIGAAAAATRFRAAPAEVRERTLDVLLDMLGVFAAACERPELVRLRERLGAAPGGATVVGSPTPTTSYAAALLNAATTIVNQIDEGHRASRGHPGIHIVPAALAVAEETGASGGALLSAILAGYEASVRVGLSLGGMRPNLHPHGNWATIGAAVAVAHLLGGDGPVMAAAIDSAAATTPAPYRGTVQQGVSAHYLYAGVGAQIGITAGYAAASGFVGAPDTLEKFFGRIAGNAFDAERLTAGIDAERGAWSRYEILNNYFKLYPSCAHTHSASDALAALMAPRPIAPDEVERVEVRTFTAAAALSNRRPPTDLAARFSIPYVMAVTLVSGDLTLDSYSGELMADERVLAMSERVHVSLDQELDAGYPAGRPTVVSVRLRDGTVLERRVDVPRGDSANPVSRDELHAKARRLLARRFGDRGADRILAIALALGGSEPVSTLSMALRETA